MMLTAHAALRRTQHAAVRTPAFAAARRRISGAVSPCAQLLSSKRSVRHFMEEHANAREDNPEAFFVVNLEDIARQHARWVRNMPRVEPFYAVKCNPDREILSLLAGLGVNFDCASPGEIGLVQELGVAPDRVVYANPCKQLSHMREAARRDVQLTVFDNEDELDKLSKAMPDASLLLRLLPDDSQSLCQFGMKYGAELRDVESLLRAAAARGCHVAGFSFHVGSGCYSAQSYATAIELAAEACAIARSLGMEPSVLDIGGGFPGQNDGVASLAALSGAAAPGAAAAATPSCTFEDIAAVTALALDTHFPLPEHRDLRVIAEPGRFFVNTSHTLATNVIARRAARRPRHAHEEGQGAARHEEQGGEREAYRYYVNDDVYGSFNSLIYDHAVVTPQLLAPPAPAAAAVATHRSSVWGQTCDGLDCIVKEVELPELEPGQWMYWEDMGAYTTSAASSFNGFDLPRTFYIRA